MADYVRRLAATRAPPPQRANVGYALVPYITVHRPASAGGRPSFRYLGEHPRARRQWYAARPNRYLCVSRAW